MKIDIIGAVGSGKTTLAKCLSEKMGIDYYEQDKIVWHRIGNKAEKYSNEIIRKKFLDIVQKDNWIMEGSPRQLLADRVNYSDYVIFLDTPLSIRTKRILKRWIKQRLGKEIYIVEPTLLFLLKNVRWTYRFERDKKRFLYELSQHQNVLKFESVESAVDYVCFNNV